MNKTKIKPSLFLVLLLLASLITSCNSAEDAEMIGSFPGQTADHGELDSLPIDSIIVYHAQIELRVGSISTSVDDIMDLARKFGGYTTYVYTWYQDTEEHATVIVSVPSFNYDSLYTRILRLGDLQEEIIIGELSSSAYRDRSQLEMSSITVHLTEKGFFNSTRSNGWRPLTTFSNAAEVAGVIFRFLFDVLIWVVVIAGPFVLIGWGIRQVAQHWQVSINKKDLKN